MSEGTSSEQRSLPRSVLLLLRGVPEEWRSSVAGDLEEEWRRRLADAPGALLADVWLLAQALRVAARLALDGLAQRLAKRLARRAREHATDLHPERRSRTMETFWNDVRYSLRTLVKDPPFTAVAVTTLALGLGANTAIYSVVRAVLIAPLPYERPEQLVVTWEHHRLQGGEREHLSYPNFRDWKERSHSFEHFAGLRDIRVNYTTPEGTERLQGGRVTDGFFAVLGVDPLLGRTFEPGDHLPGAPAVVLLDHGFFERRLGGSADVLGGSLVLDGRDARIVGILPPGFRPPLDLEGAELFLPTARDSGYFEQRSLHALIGIARLREGVSLEQAQGDLDAIAAELERELPTSNEGKGAHLIALHEQVTGGSRPLLLLLIGVTVGVLLIACTNLTSLLLARSAGRGREDAIRQALGASRVRLARQFLTESLLVGLLGGSVGVLLAPALVEALRSRLDSWSIPRLADVTVDLHAVAFAAILSILCSVAAALLPAVGLGTGHHPARAHGDDGSSGSRPRTGRTRHLLVVAEIAVAMVLLVATGLLVQSFSRLSRVDPGLSTDDVLTFRVSFPRRAYETPDRLADVHALALERLRGLPGVEAAGAATTIPLTTGSWQTDFWITGRSDPDRDEGTLFRYYLATPEYFSTLRIPLLRGRLLSDADRRHRGGAVVINETMAGRYWPDGDPLGEEIALGLSFGQEGEPERYQVVGVVGDVRHGGLDAEVMAQIYVSFRQQTNDTMHYAVRTAGDQMALLEMIRAEIAAIDRAAPIFSVATLEELHRRATGSRRVAASMIGACSGLALVLAAVGLFGLLSTIVRQRSGELAIRVALGARRAQVLRLVARQGLVLTLFGLVLGLLASQLLSRALGSLLFGVAATDATTRLVVSVVLLAVAALACYQPARVASRADPMATLRHE